VEAAVSAFSASTDPATAGSAAGHALPYHYHRPATVRPGIDRHNHTILACWGHGILTLNAGANTIQFGNPAAYAPDFDKITVPN
jgi:hypothetical protein